MLIVAKGLGILGRRGMAMALWLLYAQVICAQDMVSTLRTCTVRPNQPTIVLDSFPVMPPVQVWTYDTHTLLPPLCYTLTGNTLQIDTACAGKATMWTVQYRILPYTWAMPQRRLDTTLIRPRGRTNDIAFDYRPYQPAAAWWGGNQLQTSGAYTRGLALGNNQNLTFNANLNLQLEGKLGDDLDITAAIADNSVPLQPDGTTRQLQEFDRIYLRIRRKNAALTAGDFDFTRPEATYFAHYFKRLQGAQVEVNQPLPAFRAKPTNLLLRTAAAVSRGKFARQTIAGGEGNQGPYRLVGAAGEQFIIIPAGTERVFVDGVLQRRGQDDDYTIDYNVGELTFTRNRLITKDSRIIVEFEYTVQAYTRTTAAAQATWQLGVNRVYLNLYQEQDGRSPAAGQDLSIAQRQQLAQVGDALRENRFSGIDTLDLNADRRNRILYKSVDTMACGTRRSVLVYTASTDSARFAARFTEVGQGKGHYILAQTAANGRVFRWVAPDPTTCAPRGNFEPLVQIIAPETRALHTVGTHWQLGQRTTLHTEWALSHRDQNRFSPIGDADNTGAGGWVRMEHQFGGRDTLGWSGKLFGSVETTGARFRPLNPYRSAEFARDWNVANTLNGLAEQWTNAGVSIRHGSRFQAQYAGGSFGQNNAYSGQRHTGELRWAANGWLLEGAMNWLQSQNTPEKTQFLRPKGTLSKTFFRKNTPCFKATLYGERERNVRRAIVDNVLLPAAFWYDLGRFDVQYTAPNGRMQASMGVFQRNDYAPKNTQFQPSTRAYEVLTQVNWQSAHKRWPQTVQGSLHARQLHIVNAALTTLTGQNTYVGRMEHTLSGARHALSVTTAYEIGSGQSPRTEFTYILVNPGEGHYTWIDRNGDNVLQLDEMEVAVFADQAAYVRVAVPSPTYVRTNQMLFNQQFRWEPRLLWPGKVQGWRRAAKLVALQHTLQSNRRIFAAERLGGAANDPTVLAASALWRTVLFVNRGHPRWDASLNYNDNRSRQALVTGFEDRGVQSWTLYGRTNVQTALALTAEASTGQKKSRNEAFPLRNTDIHFSQVGPTLTWQPNSGWRAQTAFQWQQRMNRSETAERATQQRAKVEVTWSRGAAQPTNTGSSTASVLRSSLTYTHIVYTGVPNTAASFAMMDGLQPGQNWLWSVAIERQLSRTMQISLQYDGRKTGTLVRTVHTGRVQVRAVF